MEKQGYRFVGNHSAIKICLWCRQSLVGRGECYKSRFYGINSWRCCQMTPWVSCQNKCLHCWRAIDLDMNELIDKDKTDNPDEIIKGCIKAQKNLLTGFKGNSKVNMKKWKESQNPENFAISLIGEPTLYPKLGELIKELRKRGKTSFLVTNGLLPEKLIELKRKKALPTQLYLSLNYPNEEIFRKITNNKSKNAWEKLNQTLSLLPKLPTRKIVRMTLIRNLNMILLREYVKLIKKANPDFLEVKGFVSVGFARKRLGYERMPNHEEIKDFSRKLLKFLPKYKFLDEQEISRVVLLGKSRAKMKIKEEEI